MDMNGKRVFISGGAGFIGAKIAARILDKAQVVVFDTFSRNSLKDEGLENHPNLTVIKGDVLDMPALCEAVQGADIVIHAAGIAGVDTVVKNPAHTMQVNMGGTANMLEAAHRSGTCQRFINFSTSEVFGDFTFKTAEHEWTSTGAVGEARWSYAVSKLAGEHLAYAYFHQYKLPTVTVRPFNVYGPGQVGEGAIHVFVTRALQGEPLRIHNDGTQIRAWTYVDDMVDGVMLCLDREVAAGKAYNIGNPRGALTILFLAQMIVNLVDTNVDIEHVPWDFTDIQLRVPNIDKARSELGFEPKVSLEEGLQRTIEWYRSTHSG